MSKLCTWCSKNQYTVTAIFSPFPFIISSFSVVSSAFSHNSSTNLTSPSQPIYFTSLSVSLYSYRNFINTSISSSHLIPILVISNTTQIAQQNVHQDTFTPSSLSLSIISTGSINLPLVSYHLLKAHLRISYPSLLRPFIWKVLFESLILQANILLPIHRSWRLQHQELQHKPPVRSNIAANSAGTKRRMYKLLAKRDIRNMTAYLSGTKVFLSLTGGGDLY